MSNVSKVYNRDVRLTGKAKLYSNEVEVVNAAGSVVAPISASAVTGTTVTGTSVVAGTVTASVGVQSSAVAVTATATTGAAIPAGATFVSVTSDNADKIVDLPTPVLGNIIYIQEASAVGFELAPAADTQYINGTLCDAAKELAIAAGTGTLVCTCTVGGAAGRWTIFYIDEDGTIDPGGTPN